MVTTETIELSPSVMVMASYANRKYADACERNHIDAPELRQLADAIDPKNGALAVVVTVVKDGQVHADAADEVLTRRLRKRQRDREAQQRKRDRKKAQQLAGAR